MEKQGDVTIFFYLMLKPLMWMIRICFVMVLLPDSPVPKIDQNRNYLFIRFFGL